MAKMSGDVESEIKLAKRRNKKIKVCDPCVGSGALLLAMKKNIIESYGLEGLDYFEFHGMDIDPICVKMCKIQMILTNYRYITVLLLGLVSEVNNGSKT